MHSTWAMGMALKTQSLHPPPSRTVTFVKDATWQTKSRWVGFKFHDLDEPVQNSPNLTSTRERCNKSKCYPRLVPPSSSLRRQANRADLDENAARSSSSSSTSWAAKQMHKMRVASSTSTMSNICLRPGAGSRSEFAMVKVSLSASRLSRPKLRLSERIEQPKRTGQIELINIMLTITITNSILLASLV